MVGKIASVAGTGERGRLVEVLACIAVVADR